MTPRGELAARQQELVRALLAGGPVPTGFDGHRVEAEARALRAKRRSVAAQVRPDLAERLGERYRALFDTWSLGHPKQVGTSFRADLDRFETWLYAEGHLEAPRTRRWFRPSRGSRR
ncbi:hypothetical protein [Actinophytocola sp. NPDC049390]|uniref:hypothetical protein n=1 Tax=Actinophytocola sp. NPDC049390 TaxID=3363894 RepID=UPI0037B0CE42